MGAAPPNDLLYRVGCCYQLLEQTSQTSSQVLAGFILYLIASESNQSLP